ATGAKKPRACHPPSVAGRPRPALGGTSRKSSCAHDKIRAPRLIQSYGVVVESSHWRIRPPMLAHLKSPRPRISGAVRVWCLTGVLVALSLAALLMAADSMAPPLGGIQVPWWMLAAGFAVTEVFVLDVSSARNERWLTLSEVPLVIGLVFSTPATIVVAQGGGGAAWVGLYGRWHAR